MTPAQEQAIQDLWDESFRQIGAKAGLYASISATRVIVLLTESGLIDPHTGKVRREPERRKVKLGVIEFHSERLNPGLAKRFYAIRDDLTASASIVDVWLMDIASLLREFGYEMEIHSLATPSASTVQSKPPADPCVPAEIIVTPDALRTALDENRERLESLPGWMRDKPRADPCAKLRAAGQSLLDSLHTVDHFEGDCIGVSENIEALRTALDELEGT